MDASASTGSPASARDPAGAPAGAPDWETQRAEICCPMCEYNLRGLTEPRCPECGFQFAWADLQDVKRQAHPYLFEHHPERNFKSFWQTAWGGLRPLKFWRELHPAMPSRPRRLITYWCLATSMGVIAIALHATFLAIALAGAARRARAIDVATLVSARRDPVFIQSMMDRAYPLPPSREFFDWLWKTELGLKGEIAAFVLCALWPWLTMATLMIFRISMRRAKVKTIHVLRCVLYSYDAILWVCAIMAIVVLVRGLSGATGQPGAMTWSAYGYRRTSSNYLVAYGSMVSARIQSDPLEWPLVQFALFLWGAIRLAIAYRYYLKFDWPTATVIASQVILLLALLAYIAYT